MIWLVFTIMTAAVLAMLLMPLWKGNAAVTPGRARFDQAVYRDQLAELERDRARGAIGAAEAEAARNEISRRLIQAARPESKLATGKAGVMGLIGAALVPLVAIPLYLNSGNPQLADVPLSARLERAVDNRDFAALVAKVERHLAQNPDDVEGWRVLAPAYKRERRWQDAATAYANIVRLSQADAATISDYGEMLVFANEGMVTAEAARAFATALAADAKLPKARFFAGLALKQEGRRQEARQAFEVLLAESPAGAAWRPMVETELQDLAGAEERQATIRAMVDGLEERLKSNGGDLQGWQRLIRSRKVLNEIDKAKAAYATARHHFMGRPEALAALDGLAKEMGIE
ncbi:MAG: c-type cytochrome biogenesis protein CcmI [Hyphomicrobiales bacterium]